MMQIKKLESRDPLTQLKKQYMQQTTAPLDGMWLCGFVPMASHFGCFQYNELVGFFCVNDEGYLLQFFMNQNYQSLASQLFESILHRNDSPIGKINGAFVSTAEPYYFSHCLDQFSKFEVNALMYQHGGDSKKQPKENTLTLTRVDSSQLIKAVDFAVASIGASAEWLNGYFANLINRRELFGVWQNGRLVATGESRGYDEYQTGYADVGMIVAQSERGRGIATQILKQLVAMNEANGLKSICSTEKTNVAAQKAIGPRRVHCEQSNYPVSCLARSLDSADCPTAVSISELRVAVPMCDTLAPRPERFRAEDPRVLSKAAKKTTP